MNLIRWLSEIDRRVWWVISAAYVVTGVIFGAQEESPHPEVVVFVALVLTSAVAAVFIRYVLVWFFALLAIAAPSLPERLIGFLLLSAFVTGLPLLLGLAPESRPEHFSVYAANFVSLPPLLRMFMTEPGAV